ncbi:MAG: hypothetical protein KKG04_05050 [Candidatus Thermoplasmatota archaeon]|nr:hypothetical protein [Candidatus Thermoplasmatota archaeon]
MKSPRYPFSNSDIVQTTLSKIIDIIARKSVEIHAVLTLNEVKQKLQQKYDFLRYIDIKDKRDQHDFKDLRPVIIDPAFNQIPPESVGVAFHAMIDEFSRLIGKNDTYFLLSELQKNLSAQYITQIGSMGVDFELILLEREIDFLEI